MDITIPHDEAARRLIRKSDTVSCSVAFIDCKTPGSHLKENYALIGPGVTSSTDQVINLREPHGFNIGAAAMPNGITNNLHVHFTAEVFMCFRGTWTFRWGPHGDDGEYVGSAGDIVSVPTWIYRGFTNVGPDDGWLFTCLGGDNTGGIIWHPSILKGAAQHGLYLRKDNVLVDTSTGAPKPPDEDLIEPMPDAEIAKLRRWTPEEMRRRVVTVADRVYSRHALLDACLPGHASEIAPVIGHGISQDRDQQPPIVNPHGFSMEWLRLPPGQSVSSFRIPQKQVLIVHGGAVEITLNRGPDEVRLELGAWDTYSVPGSVWRSIANHADIPAEILVITSGDERKRPEWAPEVLDAAAAQGLALDANGYVAPVRLLPDYRLGAG